MSATLLGPISWSGSRDSEWHREYKITWLVEVSDPYNDGPEVVSGASGLPAPGTLWLVGAESDIYAFCRPEMDIQPVYTGELITLHTVEQTFSTKPMSDKERKGEDGVDNPLLQPADISGTFTKYTKEATRDKDGRPLLSSSAERFTGPAVERDFNRHQINITANLGTLPLAAYVEYMDTVSNGTMWGLDARCVKLSNVSYSKKYFGSGFTAYYYTVTYTFDIDFETFDRKVVNEGTLKYKGTGSRTDPANWEIYTKNGQPATALYDTNGDLCTNKNGTVGEIDNLGAVISASVGAPSHVVMKLYKETNLLTLPGVPASL